MAEPGSITVWLNHLKQGDPHAAQEIFERYFRRLAGLARSRLSNATRRAADEEDVAQSAFASFFRGIDAGRFPRLDDRDDLWRLLAMIASRKSIDLFQRETRLKRGGGQVRGESAIFAPGSMQHIPGVDAVVADEPTPEFAVEVAQECQRLLDALADDELRQLAMLKLENYTNDEIADQLGCTRSTVQRRLRIIRRTWEKELS